MRGASEPAQRPMERRAPAPALAPVRPLRGQDVNGPFIVVRHGRGRTYDAPAGGHGVALTFDDGPGPATPAVLAELRRLRARATFFVVGTQVQRRPDLVIAEHRAGMEVENHSWSHSPMARLPFEDQRAEIEDAQHVLER